MTVEELKVVITAETDKFKKAMKETTTTMGRVKKATAKASKVAAKAAKTIAVGVTAGAVALGALVLKSAAATDNIDKMSQQIGMSKKGYQEWSYILSQNGMEVDSLKMGMKTLSTQITQSIKGTGAGAEAFEKLGISVKDSSGKVKSQETIFNESVTALQGMKDGTEKAALAQQLFGRSGMELMPLLNGTADSVEDLKKKANDLGMVLSDDAIKAGVEFTDQLDTMKRVLGGVVSEIGVELMPIFTEMMDWVMRNMPTIKRVVKQAFDAIAKSVKWVIDNSNWLIPILATLAGAFVALKIIGVINGLVAAFNLVLSLNPIVLVIASLVLLGIGLYNLVKHWDKVIAVISKAWDWLNKWNNKTMKDKVVNTRYTSSSSTSQYGGVSKWTDSKSSSRGRAEYAIGSRYIPYDMTAQIHKGEMIVPKSENPYANSGNGSTLPNGGNGLSLNIEKFVNNRSQDVQSLAEELNFYMKRKQIGGSR